MDWGAKARVIIVSSTGKHFHGRNGPGRVRPAGWHYGERSDPHLKAEQFRANLRPALQDAFTCFEQARMPVIACVQGGCIGAGVDMVTACDFRFATKDAFFTIHEINIGMTADVGTFRA